MSPPSDGPVRVLLGDQELMLDGIDDVVALAREGRIDGSTRVSLPGSRSWQTAGSLPEVAAHLQRDPWAAWDEMDSSAADAAFEAYAENTDEAPRPVEPELQSDPESVSDLGTDDGLGAPSVEDLPVEAVRPMVPQTDGRMVVETPRRNRVTPPRTGQVIAFPGGSGGRATAVASLPATAVSDIRPEPVPTPLPPMDLPDRLPVAAQAPAPASSSGGTRWWRLALIAGSAVTVMLIAQWYITSTATAVFPPPGVPKASQAAATAPAAAPAPVARAVIPEASAAYVELEADLRARMVDTPREITAPGQLEDALLIELTRMQVQTASIEAPILTWAGRKNDVPQSAEIHIRYNSSPGQLERELAGIGLVVGRYVHSYALEVPVLDVTIEREGAEPRRLAIDASVAQRFYLKRVDLQAFLDALRKG
jgi:hypothetical protein